MILNENQMEIYHNAFFLNESNLKIYDEFKNLSAYIGDPQKFTKEYAEVCYQKIKKSKNIDFYLSNEILAIIYFLDLSDSEIYKLCSKAKDFVTGYSLPNDEFPDEYQKLQDLDLKEIANDGYGDSIMFSPKNKKFYGNYHEIYHDTLKVPYTLSKLKTSLKYGYERAVDDSK